MATCVGGLISMWDNEALALITPIGNCNICSVDYLDFQVYIIVCHLVIPIYGSRGVF